MATNYGWEDKSRTRIYNPKLKRYHRVDENKVDHFKKYGWTRDLPQAKRRMVIPKQPAPQEQVRTPRKTYEDFNAPQSAVDKRVEEARNRLMTNLNTYQQGYQGPTLQEIMLQRQQAAQKQIDMLKQSFAPQFQDIREQGADLKQMARSGIVARGQAGSSFAAAPKQEVDKATSEALSAKRNEMQMQISSILAAAEDRATEEFDMARARFAEDAQRGLDTARLNLALQEEEQRIQRDSGKQKLTGLARQGISLDDLAEEDYRGLLSETGLSNLEARALHQSELPAEAKKDIKHQVIGDSIVYHYFDEDSGSVKTFSEKVPGLAEKTDGGYEVQVKGDNLVFIPDNVQSAEDVLIRPMGQGEDVTHKLGRYDTLVDAEGNVIARGSQGGGYDTSSETTTTTEGGVSEPKIRKIGDDYYQWGEDTETYTPVNIEKRKITEVPKQEQAYLANLEQKINLIDEALNSKGMGAAVGAYGFNRKQFNPFLRDDTQDFIATMDQLISKEVINTLVEMKAQGGTFGAISEKELDILENAATKISKWRNKETDEFEISEERLKKELNKMREAAEIVIKQTKAYYHQGAKQTEQQTDHTKEELDFLREQGFEVPTGFSKPLSMGVKGSEIHRIAQAIGEIESGGRYNARGPIVPSGRYKGESALGKYQIMPGNLPSWSKEAVGRVVSQQEFLNSPKLQDKIAMYHMQKNYNKYGDVKDVASIWHSGRPYSGNKAKDLATGMATSSYAMRAEQLFNKYA